MRKLVGAQIQELKFRSEFQSFQRLHLTKRGIQVREAFKLDDRQITARLPERLANRGPQIRIRHVDCLAPRSRNKWAAGKEDKTHNSQASRTKHPFHATRFNL